MHQLCSAAHHDHNQVMNKVVPKVSSNNDEQQSQYQTAERESVQKSMLPSNNVSEIDIGTYSYVRICNSVYCNVTTIYYLYTLT